MNLWRSHLTETIIIIQNLFLLFAKDLRYDELNNCDMKQFFYIKMNIAYIAIKPAIIHHSSDTSNSAKKILE